MKNKNNLILISMDQNSNNNKNIVQFSQGNFSSNENNEIFSNNIIP